MTNLKLNDTQTDDLWRFLTEARAHQRLRLDRAKHSHDKKLASFHSARVAAAEALLHELKMAQLAPIRPLQEQKS